MRSESPSKNKVHVGVFNWIGAADRAVVDLVAAGFPKERITVICPTCTKEKYEDYHKQEPAGAHTVTGVATGGGIGALLGGLVAAAAMAASGGTALLIAGQMFAGSGVGAVVGGFVGAMMTRGMEPEVADYYDQALQKGQILVAVELSDEVTAQQLAEADRIFAAAGAEPVTLKKS
jgi:hypothetical protein